MGNLNTVDVADEAEGEEKPEEQAIPSAAGGAGRETICPLMSGDVLAKGQETILSCLVAQKEVLEQVLSRTARVEQRIQELERTIKALSDDHKALVLSAEELNRLGEMHWEERIVQPLVRQVFPMVDLVVGLRVAGRGKEESRKDTDGALKAVQALLMEFLCVYGIECFWLRPGSRFEPACMKVLKVVPTTEEATHDSVERCLQAGFRRGQRVLRPASVSLWRYEKPCQLQVDCSERRD